MKTSSQIYGVLQWLEKGKTITPLQALNKFGSLRLGAIIYQLKKLGYDIETKMIKVARNKYVAQYRKTS